ncbi:MAG: PhoH family protein [Alphaproteobacteria bacterium]|nr:PhoH family protein [Alphaproteobacteria bacterium]MDP6604403.1 PhoH family protein [Rhodospirillales bacterium]
MSSVTRPDEDEGAIHVDFDDNRLLPLLYGEHDKHLAQIENRLGVSLISRGNHLAISGPTEAAEIASTALRALYQRLGRGQSVDAAEVDAAVRMASGGVDLTGEPGPVIQTRKKRITPHSPTQARYIEAMTGNDLVFGLGPAGTGKTYLAVCSAVAMLISGKLDRIILSRPAVEAGERLGFLPGDVREKVDPYLRPLYDALYDTMPADQVMKRLESGEIEIAPLAFMRGRTLSDAFVILDEAQNTTRIQMKMALTRLGENSRMVVTGDLSQIDLPSGVRSGLHEAVETLEGMEGVSFVEFTDADVVRHDLVSRIVRAYDEREKAAKAKADK